MRTIKFRAWYEQSQTWVYFTFNQTMTDVAKAIHQNICLNGGTFYQFTGLTDKNGKDIYEGDIVRILYTDWGSKLESDTRTLEQYLIDIASVGSIVFNENSWEVYFGLDKYGFDSYSNINPGKHGYIEITGNIHENPELL